MIEFEVAGRRYADASEVAEVLTNPVVAEVLRIAAERLERATGGVRCPKHREPAAITLGSDWGENNVTVLIGGCCDLVVSEAWRRIASMRTRGRSSSPRWSARPAPIRFL